MTSPWLTLLCVAVGIFMVVIDVTILNVALPSLSEDLGTTLGQIEWALIAYSLTLTGLVPLFGRLGDMHGRKRLFLGGQAIFVTGSVLCASAASLPWLVAARVLQAVGGALVSSNALAILTDVFPEGRRGTAMGVQSILISGGAALGPVIGGMLVTRVGWRAVFLVNVPVGMVAMLLGSLFLPSVTEQRSHEPIDGLGALLLVGGLSSLLLGLTRGPEWGWSDPSTLVSLGSGMVVLTAFLSWEGRVAFPVIDLSLYQLKAFRGAQTAGFLATISHACLTFMLPFYWQAVRGCTAEQAGLLMLPFPLTFMVVAPLSGWLSDRTGPRVLCTVGTLIGAAGMAMLSTITPCTPLPRVLANLACIGFGMGMFMAPNNNSVMSSVPSRRRGVAAGLLATVRYTGQSLGVAVGGSMLAHALLARLPAGSGAVPTPAVLTRLAATPVLLEAYLEAFMTGFSGVCRVAMCMALLSAAASWWLRGTGAGERE